MSFMKVLILVNNQELFFFKELLYREKKCEYMWKREIFLHLDVIK